MPRSPKWQHWDHFTVIGLEFCSRVSPQIRTS